MPISEAIVTVVSKVADYLNEPAKTLAKQCFCANKISKDLDKEKKELLSELDNLRDQVEQAKERAGEIEKPINKWINEVENLLNEVGDLEQRMTATTSCLQGKCPTLERYRLCKEMMKKIKVVINFKGKSNIKPLSHPTPLPGILYRQVSKTFSSFRVTKEAIDQIMKGLQDDDTYMIGVHGMGGSGKTTAAIQVGMEAKALELFDKVMVIPISQTPDITYIQGYMADILGVKLEETSEEGRAQRLWITLKQQKQVLLIIDDLWKKSFNLKDLGISLGDHDHGKVKIIITTRDEGVCSSMGCTKTIDLNLLCHCDAWDFFKICAGIDDNFSRLFDNVPDSICRECKGLPIAIKAVGSSLKGKSKAEWRDALYKLKHPNDINDHVEGVGDVFSCLKLSYDFLPCKRDKELFLLSCICGGKHFSVETLIRYAVGLNLGGNDSLDSGRNKVEASISRLLDSGLLTCYEERIVGETPQFLKVHDMFRNTGLWIAKNFEKNHNFFDVAKTLTSPIEEEVLKDCFGVISGYNNGAEKDDFLFQLDAPNLQIMVLWGNFKSSPLLSFEGMKRLKVLDLQQFCNQMILLTLPLSIKFVKDLRYLCLSKWELGDISCISSLTKLEILDLSFCLINELPNDLDKLKRLKLLDLRNCTYLEENYNGAIGKCSQLEELYLGTSQPKKFHSEIVADIMTLSKLQRFSIGNVHFTFDAMYKKMLALVDFDISKLRVSKKNLLQQAELVFLERVYGGCRSIFPDMVGVVGTMNRLTHLQFRKCQEIECLLDTTSAFEVDLPVPNLVKLVLNELDNLKDLCRGPSIKVLRFLESLEIVSISMCCQLSTLFPRESKLKNLRYLCLMDFTGETLFSVSVAQSLQQLIELSLHRCGELKHIFSSEGEGDSNEIVPISPPRSSQSILMPKLKSFYLSECVKLESAFPNCCVEGFAALESIVISEAPKLKLIFGEWDHQNHSSHQCQSIHSHLKHLELNNLDNLIGICLEGNRARWPSLSEPLVNNCPKFTVCEEKEVENVKELLEVEVASGSTNLSQAGVSSGGASGDKSKDSVFLKQSCKAC